MSINKNELTKEQIQKAMACKTRGRGIDERRSRDVHGGNG